MKEFYIYVKNTNQFDRINQTLFRLTLSYLPIDLKSTENISGWFHINEDMTFEFIPCKFKYDIKVINEISIDEFIQNVNKESLLNIITKPLVTQKEIKNTIEVLNEIINFNKNSNKEICSLYELVINDLKNYIK